MTYLPIYLNTKSITLLTILLITLLIVCLDTASLIYQM